MGGFSQASKLNEAGAFTNLAVDEQSDYRKDIKEFGQLLATLLGCCHGFSEYTKVNEAIIENYKVHLSTLEFAP